MDKELEFLEWCKVTCGPYRTASRSVLRPLWRQGWLPQQAIEYLEKTKGFHRRRKLVQPWWDLRAPKLRKRRGRTLSWSAIQVRLAKVILGEIQGIEGHRMEPEVLAQVRALKGRCRKVLRASKLGAKIKDEKIAGED